MIYEVIGKERTIYVDEPNEEEAAMMGEYILEEETVIVREVESPQELV